MAAKEKKSLVKKVLTKKTYKGAAKPVKHYKDVDLKEEKPSKDTKKKPSSTPKVEKKDES